MWENDEIIKICQKFFSKINAVEFAISLLYLNDVLPPGSGVVVTGLAQGAGTD